MIKHRNKLKKLMRGKKALALTAQAVITIGFVRDMRLLLFADDPAGQTNGAIAQLGERYNGIVEVSGSIPLSSTNFSKNADE